MTQDHLQMQMQSMYRHMAARWVAQRRLLMMAETTTR